MKKTPRANKMGRKKLILEQYDLPNIECSRWGKGKGATRTDVLKGMLWTVFSKYIRHRDAGVCISCGRKKSYEELQAGHYAPVGGTSIELCFNEHNVNGECEYCNAWDSFHLIPMRISLINKWGAMLIENIERKKAQHLSVKWGEEEYIKRIRIYLEKLKQYEL